VKEALQVDPGLSSAHPPTMAITLLRLPTGHCSLEFASSDLPFVASAIRARYGAPVVRRYPACADHRFGGCSFTFQNEWDDPCLISESDAGDAILRELCDALAKPPRPGDPEPCARR
jgi:hypothetical protein